MAYSNRKLMREIINQLEKQGWTCTINRNCHWKLQPPVGSSIYTGSTPSDGRAIRNLKAQLRRAGATIK